MKQKNHILVFALLLFALGQLNPFCFADAGEQWLRRVSGAASQLAQGNTQGAVYQTIPYSSTKLADQTYLNAGLGGVHLQQGIAPLQKLNNPYLNFGGSYQAGSAFDLNNPLNFSQSAQVSAQNPFFTNTTTVTPKLWRRDS